MKIGFQKHYIKFIVLFLFWLVVSGEINKRSISLGVFSTVIVIYLCEKILKHYDSQPVLFRRFDRILWFFAIVIGEIFLAAWAHIFRVLLGADQTVIFDIALDFDDEFFVALIANAITLTPGTLTLEIEGNKLKILGFAKDEEEIESTRRVILEKFQKPFLNGGDIYA